TRHKLKGGRFSIAEALQTFKKGARVRLHINPAVHSGMPHPRFQGRLGTVLGSRGRAFIVGIKDGNLLKQFTCRPEHLKLEKVQVKTEATPKASKPAKAPKAAKSESKPIKTAKPKPKKKGEEKK
ncbi:MAG: hypothetical protein ABIF92_00525, partial [archaeon]